MVNESKLGQILTEYVQNHLQGKAPFQSTSHYIAYLRRKSLENSKT